MSLWHLNWNVIFKLLPWCLVHQKGAKANHHLLNDGVKTTDSLDKQWFEKPKVYHYHIIAMSTNYPFVNWSLIQLEKIDCSSLRLSQIKFFFVFMQCNKTVYRFLLESQIEQLRFCKQASNLLLSLDYLKGLLKCQLQAFFTDFAATTTTDFPKTWV